MEKVAPEIFKKIEYGAPKIEKKIPGAYRAMLGTSERASSFTLSLLSTRKLLRAVHDIKKWWASQNSCGLAKIESN